MCVYLTNYLYPCWLADGGCRHTSWNGVSSSSSTVIRTISIGGSALVDATVLSSCGNLYGQSKADLSVISGLKWCWECLQNAQHTP